MNRVHREYDPRTFFFKGLEEGKSALSLFVDDETGGILDDLIITKTSQDYLYMVTNAGCKEQDMKLLTEQLVSIPKQGLKPN